VLTHANRRAAEPVSKVLDSAIANAEHNFWFRQACRQCRVERTRMFDLGVSGVRIGEEALVPEPVRTSHITIVVADRAKEVN